MRSVIETLCDLIDHCRARLDDLPVDAEPTQPTNLQLLEQAAGKADEDALLWKTPELIVYANEAVREVALRTRCLRDNARNTAGVTSFAVTAGTTTVPLDSRLLVIRRVFWNDTVLTVESERFADEDYRDWRTDTGTPTTFLLRTSGRELRIYPEPDADGTLSLECDRLPLVLMEKGADKPEIPQHYLNDCIDWMRHLAYLKNDADTRDPTKSAEAAALFTSKVGPRPTNLQLELEYFQSGRRRPRLYYF